MTPTNALGAGRSIAVKKLFRIPLDDWIALAVGAVVLAIAPDGFTPIFAGGTAMVCTYAAVQTLAEG